MSNYKRLISYIYAYEGGVKGKNIGYAKLEVRGGQCRVQVSVKKIYVGSSEIGVYLLAPEAEILLGRIFIRGGAGEFRVQVDTQNVEGSGLEIEDFYGLTIHDVESTWQCYTTIWEDAVAQTAELQLAEVTAENVRKQEEEPKEKSLLPISAEIEQELQEEEARLEVTAPWDGDEAGSVEKEAEAEKMTAEAVETEPEIVEKEAVEAVGVEPEIRAEEAEPEKVMEPEAEKQQETEAETEILQTQQARETQQAWEKQRDQETQQAWEKQQDQETQQPQEMQQDPATQQIQENQEPEPESGVLKSTEVQVSGQAALNPADSAIQDPAQLEALDRQELEEAHRNNLWNRLERLYTKVLAFEYENDCQILSIKPQDIGLLPREVWTYGNNSFLLHGYYNYRHLILARLCSAQGGPRYLLGVPGHYFSNEKHMASMFGFPHFVLAKKQPDGDGRFGYWYTDIRL